MATITITSTLTPAERARLRRAVDRLAHYGDEMVSISGRTVTVYPPEVEEVGWKTLGAADVNYAHRTARDLMLAIGRTFDYTAAR